MQCSRQRTFERMLWKWKWLAQNCARVEFGLMLQDGKTEGGREYIKGEIKLLTPLLQDGKSGGI